MNDRELLELAAKAAGIERGADRFDSGVSITLPDGRHKSLPKWNPLDDDGDSFRLAVKLNLCIEPECEFVMTACKFSGVHPRHLMKERAATDHDGDRLAAMRVAIVRAAASLAKEPA